MAGRRRAPTSGSCPSPETEPGPFSGRYDSAFVLAPTPAGGPLQDTPLSSEIAGRYTIERELGRGATAFVYLARDKATDSLVALKVLRPELAESMSAERFLREIHVTQQLSHPSIAPVLDSGVSGSVYYCVLPYMDGDTLRTRLERERQLQMHEVLAIAESIGSALDYAHEHKVIHRDVKPENILFKGDVACLADFGIARALEDAGGMTTSTGMVRGTPAYMSPEQASGERDYDGRSDLYSLACVLYEAIAGMQAFVGPNAQAVLAQRLVHVPRSVRVYRPAVTRDVDAVLSRALAISPADRFQTAAEFTTALRTAIESPTSELRSVARRRWLVAAAVAGIAVVAAVFGPLREKMPWAPRALTAQQALHNGQGAMASWRFEEADSAFAEALALDTGSAKAALSLALVRDWSGAPRSSWSDPLARVLRARKTLDHRDSTIASALEAESTKQWDVACKAWRTLAAEDRVDFAAWFGLATCLRRDDAVVRDSAPEARWQFRASVQEMVTAYQRAFEAHPMASVPGSAARFEQVRDFLFTRSGQIRSGRNTAGELMVAQPGWANDSLVFVPVPYEAFNRGDSAARSPTRAEALVRQRRLFHDIASDWVRVSPSNPVALEALAVSLKLLGDPSALDTLQAARKFSVTANENRRLAAAEVWFRLTSISLQDSVALGRVRRLADSVLAGAGSTTSPSLARVLAPVAALVGRAALAAELAALAGSERDGPQVRSLIRDGPALLAHSALGGPADVVLRLERAVTDAIASNVLVEERARTRQQWLHHAAEIAYPDVIFLGLRSLGSEGDPLLNAQAALAVGQVSAASRYLARTAAIRKGSAPENITLDNLAAEARLLVQLDERGAAAKWLDPTLNALQRVDPEVLARVPNAGAFGRAAALRAELAAAHGDSAVAIRWARVVSVLWSGADAFLLPTVQRMRDLLRSSLTTKTRN